MEGALAAAAEFDRRRIRERVMAGSRDEELEFYRVLAKNGLAIPIDASKP